MLQAILLLFLLVCQTQASTRAAQRTEDGPRLLAELSEPATSDRATRRILQAAGKNPEMRQYVAQNLPRIIDKPETDKVWLNAVRLAGQLKLAEAVPSLARAFSRGQLGRHANTTLGAEMQLDDDVVAKALSEIGEPCLPAVRDFLNSANRNARRRAVLILLNMNVSDAQKLLQDHLARESDAKIKHLIESGLRSPGQN